MAGRPRLNETRRARSAALTVLVAASLAASGRASAESFGIQHAPPASARAWQPLAIEAVLSGEFAIERIATADVVLVGADGEYRPFPLTLSRNLLFGEIPGALVAPPAVTYFLRIVDDTGSVVTAPVGASAGAHFCVPVVSQEADEQLSVGGSGIEILTPLPGEVVSSSAPTIAGLFDPPLTEPWDALVLLDGREITGDAEVTADLFVATVTGSLAVGAHRVTFSALTAERRVETSWVFFVRERTWPEQEPEEWVLGPLEDEVAFARAAAVVAHGRIEVGWAVVAAETTAVESVDVYLPYGETSRPSLDFYASGSGVGRTFLLSAHYDPVYDERLQWSASAELGNTEFEVGDIFPTLSPTTLEWAAGLGARLKDRRGAWTTELVGLRISEADTMAGFGFYSRFALGARETYSWSGGWSSSLTYLYAFDREESVPEEQRIDDPLENSVAAASARWAAGSGIVEVEVARSWSRGESEGAGSAVRGRIGYERNYANRVMLDYVYSDPSFYSAGSVEYDPGQRGVETEFSWEVGTSVRASGSVGLYRTLGSLRGISGDELEYKLYGRLDGTWSSDGGRTRAYAVGRRDVTPYDTYRYVYTYATVGASHWRGRVRASASASWSRSHSSDVLDTWGAGGDVRFDLVPGRVSVRLAARWTMASSGDGGTDCRRGSYTAEFKLVGNETDLNLEYQLINREDRVAPEQTYAEHVLRAAVGRSF